MEKIQVESSIQLIRLWKSNSLRFSLERYCLVENIVKLENENHHGVAIAIM